MRYNPEIHHRRSIRLKGYDYSASGLYFVTICTHQRGCLFGTIQNGTVQLNEAGKLIDDCWLKVPTDFSNVMLHEYVVMPNHFHGIIEISSVGAESISAQNGDANRANMESAGLDMGTTRADMESAPTGGLSAVIQSFKRHSTIEYIRLVKQNILPAFDKRIWQRNYYEHVIRNEASYLEMANYIMNNPMKWEEDKYYAN